MTDEPTSYTNVVDAFDDNDPFDFNFNLGYSFARSTGTIQREVPAEAGGTVGGLVDIAKHKRTVNTLSVGADVGLYRDLALYLRLPVILSDSRSLSLPSGRSAEDVTRNLQVNEPSGRSVTLFDVPFKSPTRSGIDYVGTGIAWGIFNQYRHPAFPTWVLMLEGRFSVGSVLHACADKGSYVRYDGVEEHCNGGSNPGVSRGVHALRAETRISRRIGYFEPYAGLLFQIEWPTRAQKFFTPGGDLPGFSNKLPPRLGEITAGTAVIPWEDKAKWRRFGIDFRMRAAYLSQGHDYTPLYDALGVSQTDYLRQPNLEGIPAPGFTPRQVLFYGLTDVAPRGVIGGRLSFDVRLARYVQLIVSTGLSYMTPYLMTFADACNSAVNPSPGDPRQGSCVSGIIDPHQRPIIDLPGNRFRLNGELTVDFFAQAVAQF